jgi:hypothetical protein
VDCSPYQTCDTCMPVNGCGWCGVAAGGSNAAGFCSSSEVGCATYFYTDSCPSPYGSSSASSGSGSSSSGTSSGGTSSGGSSGGGGPVCTNLPEGNFCPGLCTSGCTYVSGSGTGGSTSGGTTGGTSSSACNQLENECATCGTCQAPCYCAAACACASAGDSQCEQQNRSYAQQLGTVCSY